MQKIMFLINTLLMHLSGASECKKLGGGAVIKFIHLMLFPFAFERFNSGGSIGPLTSPWLPTPLIIKGIKEATAYEINCWRYKYEIVMTLDHTGKSIKTGTLGLDGDPLLS